MFIKKLIEEELQNSCFGEGISLLYKSMTLYEKRRTLENIIFFYKNRQSVTAFARQILVLYPQSLVFAKKDDCKNIYVYLGVAKNKEDLWKINRCKDLFLEMNTQIHIAWEEGFLLTDMKNVEPLGNIV